MTKAVRITSRGRGEMASHHHFDISIPAAMPRLLGMSGSNGWWHSGDKPRRDVLAALPLDSHARIASHRLHEGTPLTSIEEVYIGQGSGSGNPLVSTRLALSIMEGALQMLCCDRVGGALVCIQIIQCGNPQLPGQPPVESVYATVYGMWPLAILGIPSPRVVSCHNRSEEHHAPKSYAQFKICGAQILQGPRMPTHASGSSRRHA
ncbi:hypothetical protein CERZMDRAFT_80409 [Cercospora zeae-maydis SCOH1-5]|uniref:Uncharacterized protein n=1 Tax=Cercospora zeae-maydis SCOH1-5 TaxID=717836 RepID=A0A6A6FWW3_9PEZI|nr:hypothetical protein CERZMDRAFT_80409 [Cercospora zeae-maydis SCOH1-5]